MYLQSLRKFLQVRGHSSVCKSTTMSPKLVTISTDIFTLTLYAPESRCSPAKDEKKQDSGAAEPPERFTEADMNS